MGVGATDLRRIATALAAAVAAVACSQSTGPQPTPTTAPPSELIFIVPNTHTGGHVVVIEARDGAQVADLQGFLVATLDQGGDIAEAYLIANGGLASVRPGRPFVTTPIDATVSIGLGVLVAAPNLQTFVGSKTVLIVSQPDSSLVGYQHGRRIWTVSIGQGAYTGAPTLRPVGDQALVYTPDGLKLVVPETGALKDLPGPCGVLTVTTIGSGFLCYAIDGGPHVIDTASGRTTPVTDFPEASFHAVKQADLYLQSGQDFYRLDSGGKLVWHRHVVLDPGQNGALAPNGSAFYLAHPHGGITVVPTADAAVTTLPGPTYNQVAVSRDGTFLYGLTDSSLDLLHLPDGRLFASYPPGGSAIRLVAGG